MVRKMFLRKMFLCKIIAFMSLVWMVVVVRHYFLLESGGKALLYERFNSNNVHKGELLNNNDDTNNIDNENINIDGAEDKFVFPQNSKATTKHMFYNKNIIEDTRDNSKGKSGEKEEEKNVYEKYLESIMKDIGEEGKAIHIEKDQLPPEERGKYDKGFENHSFNEYASSLMSLHRSLPEVRPKQCLEVKYGSILPSTSVIICFHNEAWSTLLRTVHTALERTRPELIKEIILVDDFSDQPHLQEQLEEYVATVDKVRIIRTKQREGLIRARLVGASISTGEVLTFLDSHCECSEGWLSPLLERIARDPTIVAVPTIDVIDSNTLQYVPINTNSVGGFQWNLSFAWIYYKDMGGVRRQSSIDPLRSPTMPGGLFAINKKYFEHIGSFDTSMDIWGGENLEISFRIWMCGGSIEFLPCSHIGHIFRKKNPNFNGQNIQKVLSKNYVRLAEVWMDEYKKYFYEKTGYKAENFGDISERLELRQRLQCKGFDWYIKNIYPEVYATVNITAEGEIRNQEKKMCLDAVILAKDNKNDVSVWPCHGKGGNQMWKMTALGEIRREEACMDLPALDGIVRVYDCHRLQGNQKWAYEKNNSIKHVSGLCMELSEDGQHLKMAECNGSDRQAWLWKRVKSLV